MKITTLMGAAMLLVFFGIATPACAQEQHEQQPEKDAAPSSKTPNDRETKDAKPPKDERQPEKEAAPPARTPNDRETKDAKPPRNEQQPEKDAAPPARDERPKAEQQRTDRPSRQAQRIPDDKFRAHFGREHRFHVGHPVIVEGRPRFQYGGYSFFITQPWPRGWGYDDDVYVVDVDGVYYLVDVAHPGVQLALEVVL